MYISEVKEKWDTKCGCSFLAEINYLFCLFRSFLSCSSALAVSNATSIKPIDQKCNKTITEETQETVVHQAAEQNRYSMVNKNIIICIFIKDIFPLSTILFIYEIYIQLSPYVKHSRLPKTTIKALITALKSAIQPSCSGYKNLFGITSVLPVTAMILFITPSFSMALFKSNVLRKIVQIVLHQSL